MNVITSMLSVPINRQLGGWRLKMTSKKKLTLDLRSTGPKITDLKKETSL